MWGVGGDWTVGTDRREIVGLAAVGPTDVAS